MGVGGEEEGLGLGDLICLGVQRLGFAQAMREVWKAFLRLSRTALLFLGRLPLSKGEAL